MEVNIKLIHPLFYPLPLIFTLFTRLPKTYTYAQRKYKIKSLLRRLLRYLWKPFVIIRILYAASVLEITLPRKLGVFLNDTYARKCSNIKLWISYHLKDPNDGRGHFRTRRRFYFRIVVRKIRIKIEQTPSNNTGTAVINMKRQHKQLVVFDVSDFFFVSA